VPDPLPRLAQEPLRSEAVERGEEPVQKRLRVTELGVLPLMLLASTSSMRSWSVRLRDKRDASAKSSAEITASSACGTS
jgi:hypothetical protein